MFGRKFLLGGENFAQEDEILGREQIQPCTEGWILIIGEGEDRQRRNAEGSTVCDCELEIR